MILCLCFRFNMFICYVKTLKPTFKQIKTARLNAIELTFERLI